MRLSALGGSCLLVLGLAVLSGALYYDQAHAAEWTQFAPSSNMMNAPAEAMTAQIFTLTGAIASGFAAVIAAGSALISVTGRAIGHWTLRLTSVLLLVLLLLISAALLVGAFTAGEPAAIISTPPWLLTAECAALALAIFGAGVATVQLWRFVPEQV
jgi:hypothetical protein